MQVEVTWTVPAAAAPRAGPARRHRDGHARRGRWAGRAAPACGVRYPGIRTVFELVFILVSL